MKLESREGGEEARRVGIINQSVSLLLIKSTNLFVRKPHWVNRKRQGWEAATTSWPLNTVASVPLDFVFSFRMPPTICASQGKWKEEEQTQFKVL